MERHYTDTDCLVLRNPAAGPGEHEDSDAALAARFTRHGLRAEIVPLVAGLDVAARVREALARGVRRVVAAGGDGTVSQVAGALAGSKAALGVLPQGTLNHFAKDLGIPLETEDAIAVLAAGNLAPVDAACVNERVFINNSGIGLYPSVVRHRKAQQERLGRGKWFAFAWACLVALGRLPMLRVQVRADGQAFARRSAFVFVGNNAYDMEGLDIGRRPALDGGTLSFYASRDVGRLGILGFALRALFGRLSGAPGLEALQASELVVDPGQADLDVSVDGEVVRMRAPLRYRSLPGALQVCVPVERVRADDAEVAHTPSPSPSPSPAPQPSQPPSPAPSPPQAPSPAAPGIPAPEGVPAPATPSAPVDPPVATPVDPPVPAPTGVVLPGFVPGLAAA